LKNFKEQTFMGDLYPMTESVLKKYSYVFFPKEPIKNKKPGRNLPGSQWFFNLCRGYVGVLSSSLILLFLLITTTSAQTTSRQSAQAKERGRTVARLMVGLYYRRYLSVCQEIFCRKSIFCKGRIFSLMFLIPRVKNFFLRQLRRSEYIKCLFGLCRRIFMHPKKLERIRITFFDRIGLVSNTGSSCSPWI
jgi:hypothetical protein